MRFAAVVLLCAGSAAAQIAPAADPAVEALRLARKAPAAEAIARLRRDAAAEAGAKEVFAALFDPEVRAALAARLKGADKDGSLRAELEALSKAASDLGEARRAAESIDEKSLGEGRPGGPVDEPDGFSGTGDVNAGGVSAGGRTAPVLDAHGEVGYKKGPWDSVLEFEGMAAPSGGRDPGVYSLGVGVQRKIGDSSNFVYAEGEAERDELLGVSFSRALRVGVGRDLIDSARQALTVAVGMGPNVEGTFAGADRFLSPAVDVDYTLHLAPAWKLVQKVEAEFNVKDAADVELHSVTQVVYKVSEKLSVAATQDLKARTEQVLGYAKSRVSRVIGIIYEF